MTFTYVTKVLRSFIVARTDRHTNKVHLVHCTLMIICFAVRFEIAGSNDETLQSAIKVLIENKQTN